MNLEKKSHDERNNVMNYVLFEPSFLFEERYIPFPITKE